MYRWSLQKKREVRIAIAFLVLMIGIIFAISIRKPELRPVNQVIITDQQVKIEIVLLKDERDLPALSATFTPLDPSFYLYSMDLPFEGIDGIGRPTYLELVQNDHIQKRGELTANISPMVDQANELSRPLWIYPAGPVTLRFKSMPSIK